MLTAARRPPERRAAGPSAVGKFPVSARMTPLIRDERVGTMLLSLGSERRPVAEEILARPGTKPHTRENPCRSTPSKSAGPGGDGLKDWLFRGFAGLRRQARRRRRHFILALVTGHQKGLRSAVGKGDRSSSPTRGFAAGSPWCGPRGRGSPIYRGGLSRLARRADLMLSMATVAGPRVLFELTAISPWVANHADLRSS